MKLYYSPGACSLASHITIKEAGLPVQLVLASTKTHKLEDGTDYYTINPLGYVPLLELDNGTRLHENPAVLPYLADQAPDKRLAPASGTFERYQLQSWLAFVGTELHKNFSPFFNPAANDEFRASVKTRLLSRFRWVDQQLAGRDYLMGETFTVADAYLFTVSTWTARFGIDLSDMPNLQAWRARVAARPAVKAAMEAEGLLKAA
jgi:glutathione S-transferase